MPTIVCWHCDRRGYIDCGCWCRSCAGSKRVADPKRPPIKGHIYRLCPACRGARCLECPKCKGVGYLYRSGWWKYSPGRSVNDAVNAPWWAELLLGQSATISCSECLPSDKNGAKRGKGYLECKCDFGDVVEACGSCRGTAHIPDCEKCHGTGRFQCHVCLGTSNLKLAPALSRLPSVQNEFLIGDWKDNVYQPYHPLTELEVQRVIDLALQRFPGRQPNASIETDKRLAIALVNKGTGTADKLYIYRISNDTFAAQMEGYHDLRDYGAPRS